MVVTFTRHHHFIVLTTSAPSWSVRWAGAILAPQTYGRTPPSTSASLPLSISSSHPSLTPQVLVRAITKGVSDLCATNSCNLSGAQVPREFASFFSLEPQPFSLYFYVHRLVAIANCSPSVFISALIYLDRIQAKQRALLLSELNCHRLLSTAVLLATKWLDDESVNNSRFALVSGMSLDELNRLEFTMLYVLDWSLYIEPLVYYHREKFLLRTVAMEAAAEKEPTMLLRVHRFSVNERGNNTLKRDGDGETFPAHISR